MSFAGHVFDMISRNKANLEMKRRRRNRSAEIKEMYQKKEIQNEQSQIRNKNIPPQKLAQKISKIRKAAKRERIKEIIIGLILLIIAIIISIFIIPML